MASDPLRIEVEREEDGRLLASVPDLPGVMTYGETEEEAIRKVKSRCAANPGGHDRERRAGSCVA